MAAMPVVDDGWALARWEAVVARLPDPHPFVLPEWQRAWWTHFGSGEGTRASRRCAAMPPARGASSAAAT